MPRRGSHRWEIDIANFYCEIAATNLAHSDFAEAHHQLALANFYKTGIILAALFVEHTTPCSTMPNAIPRLKATLEEIHNVPRNPDGGATRR